MCKFANIFGKPGEGFHSARLLGMARNDLVLTVIAGIIIAMVTGTDPLLSTVKLFFLGQIFHYWFKVDTAYMKWSVLK